MVDPVIVLISKYVTIASTILQVSAHFYPSLTIESVRTFEEVRERNPFRIIAVVEEEVCGELLNKGLYPARLRMIRQTHAIIDFVEILREEGIEPEIRGRR